MNVYDFDDTIYAGDCSVQFWLYCLKRSPLLLIALPWQLFGIIAYKLGMSSKTRMKEHFFSFLRGVDNPEKVVQQFWQKHRVGMEAWYLAQQREDDVIISASPEFLLRPICESIGIRFLISSRVSSGQGKFLGENCYGEEKLRRFREEFPGFRIHEFYSDSLSDMPLAKQAERAYLCHRGKLTPWR